MLILARKVNYVWSRPDHPILRAFDQLRSDSRSGTVFLCEQQSQLIYVQGGSCLVSCCLTEVRHMEDNTLSGKDPVNIVFSGIFSNICCEITCDPKEVEVEVELS